MTRLWDEERAAGSRTLRLATLERLQGAEQIVRSHLDDSLAELTPASQDVAARIFRQLVTQSGMKVAYTPADLVEHAEVPEPEVRAVLDELSQGSARILRAVADESGGGGVRYEIFHDVLAAPILDWRRRHVAEAQRAEDEAKRRAAEQTAQRERHRARIFRAVAVASGVFAAGVAVLAVLAVRAKQEAQSQRLAAVSASQLRVDPAASVRIALEALDRSETPEADEALRAAVGASRVRAVFTGHRGWIVSVAYSPDGRVVTAGADGTSRVWDPGTGKQLAVIRGHDGDVAFARFGARGERVISAGYDGTVRVSDARSGRGLADFRPYDGVLDASGLALSPDGTRIVTIGDVDRGAHVWDAETGKRLRTIGDDLNVISVAFGDAGTVATGTDEARVHVWDARTGEKISTLDVDPEETVTHVEFSPDGRRLVAGTDQDSYLWTRWRRGGKGDSLTFDDGAPAPERPHFSPDGRSFVTVGENQARLWSRSGSELATLRGHRDVVLSAEFSPDGARVVTTSQDGTARVWSQSGEPLAELHGHTDLVEDGRFSPDGRTVVTAGADGSARVWDVSERSLAREQGEPPAAAQFAGGERLVTAAFSDAGVRVRVWQTAATPRVEQRHDIVAPGVGAGDDSLAAVALGAGGERLAFGSDNGRVAVHEAGGRRVAGWTEAGPVSAIGLSHDGRLVAASVGTARGSAGDPWSVLIRPAQQGRRGPAVRLEGHNESLNDIRFSPDGRFVVTASDDKTARIWRVSDGRALHVLRGHAGLVWSADWSSDGARVVTAGNDGTVRIWNAADGKPVRVLSGFIGAANAATFANGDRWILAGGNDGTTRIWEAETGRPLAIMREHAVAVTTVAMHRNTILSASEDGDAKLYACQTCGSLDELRELAELRLRFVAPAGGG